MNKRNYLRGSLRKLAQSYELRIKGRAFKRKREDYGWYFNALIVINEDLVIYKLWGGKPMTHEFHETKKPLGPFQESESIMREATPIP